MQPIIYCVAHNQRLYIFAYLRPHICGGCVFLVHETTDFADLSTQVLISSPSLVTHFLSSPEDCDHTKINSYDS